MKLPKPARTFVERTTLLVAACVAVAGCGSTSTTTDPHLRPLEQFIAHGARTEFAGFQRVERVDCHRTAHAAQSSSYRCLITVRQPGSDTTVRLTAQWGRDMGLFVDWQHGRIVSGSP